VRIKARLFNGITLDITNWTFRDVTPGRVSFSIDTVSDGTTAGVVKSTADVQINGRNFPAKEELTITWVCGTKSGTVAADKFTANVSRITIDKSAFSSLTAEDDGLAVEFTVKGCFNKVTKSATYANMGPRILGVQQDALAAGHLKLLGGKVTITGRSIQRPSPGDTVKIEVYNGTTLDAVMDTTSTIEDNTETKLVLTSIMNDSGKDDSYWANKDATLAMTIDGVRITYPVHFDPSV